MKVAGGLLLFLLAADMVMGQTFLRATPAEQKAGAEEPDISVFPLAIPLLAGPSVVTSMILMREQTRGNFEEYAAVIAALILVLAPTLLCLLGASTVSRLLGKTGGHVIGRVSGVLLAALAAQIALDGVPQRFSV